MMDTGSGKVPVIRYGYVEFRSKHVKKWKRRWLVFYKDSDEYPARIVKYTDEREAMHKPNGRHQYPITDFRCVERMPGKDRAVRIHFNDPNCKCICFTCDSEASANDWVRDIQFQLDGGTSNRDTYPVKLLRAPHIKFEGEVQIQVRDCHLVMKKEGVQDEPISIPLTTIRKYQMDKDNVFWIETGRSSPVGEGFIYFKSYFAYCVLSKLDEVARQTDFVRRTSLSSNSGDTPLQATRMPPGPRSPTDPNLSPTYPIAPHNAYPVFPTSPTRPDYPTPSVRVAQETGAPPLPRPRPRPRQQIQIDPDNLSQYPPSRVQPPFSPTPPSFSGQRHQYPPGTASYSPLGNLSQYPLIPQGLSQSMSRLPAPDQGQGYQGARSQTRHHEAESIRPSRTGTGMVAPQKEVPVYRHDPGVREPYMPMASTGKPFHLGTQSSIPEEERVSYVKMTKAEAEEQSSGPNSLDYLHPVAETPNNARFSSDDRHS